MVNETVFRAPPLVELDFLLHSLDILQCERELGATQRTFSLTLESLHMDDLAHKFVFTDHWRGLGVHIDHRWERIKNGDILDGMTVAHMKPGIAKKPIDTLSEAREMLRHSEYYKISNEPSALRMFAEEKKPEPREWLTVEGVVEKGEVGATRYEFGVFATRDRGVQYCGAQKPFFKEFFLYGKKYTGRWVYRQIERRRPERAKTAWLWQFGKPLDQEPYVLSRRAENDNWVPPWNVSCLPPEVRAVIPNNYKYWLRRSIGERLRIRNELRQAIKKGAVKLKYEKRLPCSLQHHWWKRFAKGKPVVVIRVGPSAEHWDLRIKEAPPPTPLIHFVLTENPLEVNELGAIWRPCKEHEWLYRGYPKPEYIPPGKPGNPTKATAAFVELIDKGTCVIFEKTDMFMKIQFFMKQLKGLYVFNRETKGAPYWRMKKSELPETK